MTLQVSITTGTVIPTAALRANLLVIGTAPGKSHPAGLSGNPCVCW